MKNEMKELRIYIYDTDIMKEALLDVANFLKHLDYSDLNLFIKKGWVNGFHIAILFNGSDSFELNIRNFLKEKIKVWKLRSALPDYENINKKIEKVAKIEKYSENYMPIRKQFHIEIMDFTPNFKIRNNLYLYEEMIKTNFFTKAAAYYYSLNDNEKIIFMLKLMITFSDCGIKEGEYEIEESYFSFKSHYEGFKAQLNLFNEDLKLKCINAIDNFSTQENDFLNSEFISFVKAERNSFIDYSNQDKELLIEFQKLFKKLLNMYIIKIKDHEVSFPEENTLEKFLESELDNLSEYHKSINKEFDKRFFNSDEFILGRLITNWFYTSLPLYSISPLMKHKLCNLLCTGIEIMTGHNSEQMIQNFAYKLKEG